MSNEPKSILDLYGPDVQKPGSYAANCLLARRLAERGVRFIQLYHMGWDQHGDLPAQIKSQCHDTDQPSAALVKDLKQRGLLDDTLIIWGGEFGRTIYSQGQLTATNYGRDHHPRCFTIWLAGGGIKPGMTLGETDDFSYNIVQRPGRGLRLERDDPPPAGHRPHPADLQVPGPRFPAHGRAWQGGQGDFGLIPRCHSNAKRLIFAATGRDRQFVISTDIPLATRERGWLPLPVSPFLHDHHLDNHAWAIHDAAVKRTTDCSDRGGFVADDA